MKRVLEILWVFIVQVVWMCLIIEMLQLIYWMFNHTLPLLRDFRSQWDFILVMSLVFTFQWRPCTLVLPNTERNLDMIHRIIQYKRLSMKDESTHIKTCRLRWRDCIPPMTVILEQTEAELRFVAPRAFTKGVETALNGYDVPPPIK